MKQSKFLSWLSSSFFSIVETFTKKQWTIFYCGSFLIIFGLLFCLYTINNNLMVSIPRTGGIFTEGIIGTPRFINPVLAISDADKDLTKVVYSGLMKHDSNGNIVPDIAKSVSISPDEKTYTFILRDDVFFHNNTKVTVDDVIYTIETIQNPLIKSPQRTSWEGVSIKKIDEQTISFTLKQRYVSFLDNTTIGIIPKKLWSSLTPEQFPLSDLNANAVGTGPYKVNKIIKSSSGIPTSYSLTAFNDYIHGTPYIKNLEFVFFGNEKEMVSGLQNNTVDAISRVSPTYAIQFSQDSHYTIKTKPLPRVFSLFLNQNKAPIFTNKTFREILNKAIDRQKIITNVLNGYGTEAYGPIPSWITKNEPGTQTDIIGAEDILKKEGYVRDTDGIYVLKSKKGVITERLSFTLATANTPELKKVAEVISEELQVQGIEVKIEVFEPGTLTQDIIRNRSYQALLFGQNIEQEAELFAFWHSSQRNDPGLNIALYANARVDEMLEKIHKTKDQNDRTEIYQKIASIIEEDVPVVALYSPSYTYILSKTPSGLSFDHFISPEDRFENIHTWFINTEQVWKWFAH